ncbi:hypothetical protein AB0H37_38295 [Actinomadura sp. NPDC023710]|uniref:hypothetical protein n=1 Tax=Actinomadura sp. NPDC023710 TaxID=3158219 RepID=UPI0033D11D2C
MNQLVHALQLGPFLNPALAHALTHHALDHHALDVLRQSALTCVGLILSGLHAWLAAPPATARRWRG